jgi:hypothetical protein
VFSELDLQQSPPDIKVFWDRDLTNLKRARDWVARRYNALRSEAVFRVWDLVLLKLHVQSSKALKRSAKIENKLSNPLLIARFLIKVTVQLANPDTGVIVRKAHVSQLKRYFTDD